MPTITNKIFYCPQCDSENIEFVPAAEPEVPTIVDVRVSIDNIQTEINDAIASVPVEIPEPTAPTEPPLMKAHCIDCDYEVEYDISGTE